MVEPSERIVHSGQIPHLPPIERTPQLALTKSQSDGHSTLAKAADITPAFKPSKPELDKPMPVWEMLAQVNRLERASDKHSLQKEGQIDRLFDNMQKLHIEQSLKLEESYTASKDATFWSILEDVGNSVMSSVSFFYGFTALSTGGTAVGGALIASGVLSLSNIAFKHVQAWDWIAVQVSNGDQELRHAIATYAPVAVGIIAAAIGAYGAYSSWQYSHLSGSSQTQSIIQSTATIVKGITDFGNSQAASHFRWMGAEVSALQTKSELTTLDLENVVEEVKDFQKKLVEVQELAARLVQDTDRAIQITQQSV